MHKVGDIGSGMPKRLRRPVNEETTMPFISILRSKFVVSALFSCLLAAGSVQSAELSGVKTEAGELRMGMDPWIGYGPWYIAQQKGIFKKNGLNDVQLVNFDEYKDRLAAFASGQMDFMNLPTQAALQLLETGVPVHIVLLLDFSLDADAILGDRVNSITDLKGKKVAYEESSTSDILLNYALSQNGMSISDIERAPMTASQAGTALVAGQVPVAVTYEPYISAALNANKDAKIVYSAGKDPGLISDVLVVSDRALKEKPGQIMALIRSWQDAIATYNQDAKGSRAIIANAVGSDEKSLETAFNGVKFYNIADNKKALSGQFTAVTINDVKKASLTAKIINKDVDTTHLVDDSFVKSVK